MFAPRLSGVERPAIWHPYIFVEPAQKHSSSIFLLHFKKQIYADKKYLALIYNLSSICNINPIGVSTVGDVGPDPQIFGLWGSVQGYDAE
jgi:hypothetical protein